MALNSTREIPRLSGAPTLHQASYRGAAWFVTNVEKSGGRKDVKKTFVGSDRQVIEDLGRSRDIYTVSGVIAARLSTPTSAEIISYDTARKTLEEAFKLGGRGIYVDPFDGRLENMVVRTWSIGQTMTELGMGRVSVTFEVSDVIPILPTPSETSVSLVVEKNEALVAAAKLAIGGDFEVTTQAPGNFLDATDKANSFIDKINLATDPIAQVATKINDFSNEVSKFSADVTTLVAAPTSLATSITGLFATVNGLYATVLATFRVLIVLFDFGDDDVGFDLTTAGRIERQRNREVINLNVRAIALGYAYQNAVQIDYTTVAEIDDASNTLEREFQRLFVDPMLSSDVLDPLTELRLSAQGQLDAKKLTTRDTIEVVTHNTSTRLLAFRHYGSSELGDQIALLNELAESVPIDGAIRIFTS